MLTSGLKKRNLSNCFLFTYYAEKLLEMQLLAEMVRCGPHRQYRVPVGLDNFRL